MARERSIDRHPKKTQIIKDIVKGKDGYRKIAERYGLSTTAVHRYLHERLHKTAAEAMLAESKAAGEVVLTEMADVMSKTRKLLDACDEWLTDPDDPDKYFLGPRGDEITITYNEIKKRKIKGVVKETKVKRKETLEQALARLNAKDDREILRVSYRHYDIRKLILDNADSLTKQLNLMAEIKGAIPDIKVNITISEAWMYIKQVIIDATKGHPDVRGKIIDGIRKSNIER